MGSAIYETDFYGWTQEQAELIKAGLDGLRISILQTCLKKLKAWEEVKQMPWKAVWNCFHALAEMDLSAGISRRKLGEHDQRAAAQNTKAFAEKSELGKQAVADCVECRMWMRGRRLTRQGCLSRSFPSSVRGL